MGMEYENKANEANEDFYFFRLKELVEEKKHLAQVIRTFKEPCPICFGSLLGTDEVVAGNCGHVFHRVCLDRCSHKCPTCRTIRQNEHVVREEESTKRAE